MGSIDGKKQEVENLVLLSLLVLFCSNLDTVDLHWNPRLGPNLNKTNTDMKRCKYAGHAIYLRLPVCHLSSGSVHRKPPPQPPLHVLASLVSVSSIWWGSGDQPVMKCVTSNLLPSGRPALSSPWERGRCRPGRGLANRAGAREFELDTIHVAGGITSFQKRINRCGGHRKCWSTSNWNLFCTALAFFSA